jgi:multidrug efflux system membrane fusion protein
MRPITVGRALGDLTTVDKGVERGEQVVIDGQSRLTPNARVDVKVESSAGGSVKQATK